MTVSMSRLLFLAMAFSIASAADLKIKIDVPGGGWLSSAPDMARFEVAILTDRLIKRWRVRIGIKTPADRAAGPSSTGSQRDHRQSEVVRRLHLTLRPGFYHYDHCSGGRSFVRADKWAEE
jgi:hypothetical protein